MGLAKYASPSIPGHLSAEHVFSCTPGSFELVPDYMTNFHIIQARITSPSYSGDAGIAQKAIDALQCFLDLRHRCRIRTTDMAFPAQTEHIAGHDSHFRFNQQPFCELL